LGPFIIVLETIGAKSYIFELPSTARLHPVFHVHNLRRGPTASLRPYVSVSTLEDDDDQYDLGRISLAKVDIVLVRRGNYMMYYYTHFKDEHIPLIWHRRNELQRTFALQYFLDLMSESGTDN
jgi:hypothetical protein